MSTFKTVQPGAAVVDSIHVIGLVPGQPCLFRVNAAAKVDHLLEFADLAIQQVVDALERGVQNGISAEESWQLGKLLELAQGAVRAVVGQP
jgi:hypothetical protein